MTDYFAQPEFGYTYGAQEPVEIIEQPEVVVQEKPKTKYSGWWIALIVLLVLLVVGILIALFWQWSGDTDDVKERTSVIITNPTGARVLTVTVTPSGVFAINGVSQPTLNLSRGQTYQFLFQGTTGCTFEFYFATMPTGGDMAASALSNITGYPAGQKWICAGQSVTFTVDASYPSQFFYADALHANIGGVVNVV